MNEYQCGKKAEVMDREWSLYPWRRRDNGVILEIGDTKA